STLVPISLARLEESFNTNLFEADYGFLPLWQPPFRGGGSSNLCELSHSNVYAWKQTHVLGPNREERNEPANARLSVEFIAKIKGIDVAEVIRVTSANAKRLFKIPVIPRIAPPPFFPSL
uniref:Uncharacterized protein n=1 Tax=Meloidogyne incognita TaxID=6306 RepID=A0A914P2S8_MELIC